MIEKYKNGITLFSILSLPAILFPPIIWKRSTHILDTGFAFIFSIPKYNEYISGYDEYISISGSIHFSILFLEFFFILILAVLFQLYYKKK